MDKNATWKFAHRDEVDSTGDTLGQHDWLGVNILIPLHKPIAASTLSVGALATEKLLQDQTLSNGSSQWA